MIKLLAVDMDGTCLDSKGQMSEETLNALKKASEKGIIVVPTTGRNANCLPKLLKKESFYRYIISSNGSLVIDLKENREIFTSYIDSKTATELLGRLRGMIMFKAAHIDRNFCVQGKILKHEVEKFFNDDSAEIINIGNMKRYISKTGKPIEEFQFFYKSKTYRDKIRKILEDYPLLCSAHSKGYAEIFNKSGSKGTALLALAKELGIEKEEIACMGDEENDISMFNVAGMPMAMGNGIKELKELAEIVLPANDENGVAEGVNILLSSLNGI